jgi:hypothetical protein
VLPVSAVLEEGLTFWMDTMRDPVLEELKRREIEAQSEAQAQDFLERLRNGKSRVVVFPG